MSSHTSSSHSHTSSSHKSKPPVYLGKTNGVVWLVLFILVLLIGFILNKCKENREDEKEPNKIPENHQPADMSQGNGIQSVKFPTSGKAHCTTSQPLKAYLDPLRTYTRRSGSVKYVLASDPSIQITFTQTNGIESSGEHNDEWLKYKSGNYYVYALADDVEFEWWR